MDRAIAYTLLGQGWTVLAGPITLWFLASRLSPQEQGFYYTFGSFLGLQIFLELGLGFVLLQFASHEKASLSWSERGTLEGDAFAKARLSSLLRRTLGWYCVLSAIFLLLILPAGFWFFGRNPPAGAPIVWQLPWLWVVIVTTFNLLLTPFFSIVQGLGIIAESALLKMCQNIATSLVTWTLLWQGAKLFTAPAFSSVMLLMGVCWLLWRQKTVLLDLLAFRHEQVGVDWKREVWPFQWKVALSGISGYFVFLFFNPVLFAFQGATAAGQMGMSSAIMGAVAFGGGAWINTKVAPFGELIARREWDKLNRLFFPALWQSSILILVGGSAIWAATSLLQLRGYALGQRFLPPLPMGLFVAATLVNHVVGAQALYLRAHKQDPFIWISVALGASIGLSTYFAGRYFGATGMMLGYLLLSLFIGVGMGTRLFMAKRHLWHVQGHLPPELVLVAAQSNQNAPVDAPVEVISTR